MPRDIDYPQNIRPEEGTRIDGLVNTSMVGKKDKARKAAQELGQMLTETGSLEPFVLTIHRLLSAMSQRKDPREVTRAGEVLGHLMQAAADKHRASGPDNLELDSVTVRLVDQIGQTGQVLNQKSYFASRWGKNLAFLNKFAGSIKEASESGQKNIEVGFATPDTGISKEERAQRLEAYSHWARKLSKAGSLHDREDDHYFIKDEVIDLVRDEPDTSFLGQARGRVLESEHETGMSLSKIEKLENPTDPEVFKQILAYFTAVNKSGNEAHIRILTPLLLEPSFYRIPQGIITFKNEKMIANIAKFQEQLVNYVVLGAEDESINRSVDDLLKSLNRRGAFTFAAMTLQTWSMHPYEVHPDYAGNIPFGQDVSTLAEKHPIMANAVAWHLQEHGEGFTHWDKIAREYLVSELMPLVTARLVKLGIMDKFAQGFEEIKGFFAEKSHEEINVESIIETLNNNGGMEFVEKLKDQSGQIREATTESWNSTFEVQRPHFLPMEGGVETIDFEDESLPNLIGIDSLSVKRLGPLTDWSVAVSFRLKGRFLSIVGELNNSGEFSTNPEITKKIPHFADLLGYVAVAGFHDLVIQREAEKRKGKSRKPAEPDQNNYTGEETLIETQGGMLPRRQSSSALIENVYKITRAKPRRVDLHRAKLRGADAYTVAVSRFKSLKDSGFDTDMAEQQLVQARAAAYNISEGKKRNVPAKFELMKLTDPITGEERHLQTWVIEHTSPRPTDEELANPTLLFRRYYKGSSNLAFLDQLKPWIVGE